MNSQIRKDYFQDRYVIISPMRDRRPHARAKAINIFQERPCVFCPERIEPGNIVDQIKSGSRWQVLDIKNIFPALSTNNNEAYGCQEVIVEAREHDLRLHEQRVGSIVNVLKMFAKRTAAISRDKRIDYILCFKNEGCSAGASIRHSHSQIFASELLPPDLVRHIEAKRAYRKKHNTCPYCDILAKEEKTSRLVFADKNIVALAPYASAFQYEAWIITRRHLDNITRLDSAELDSLANALKIVLTKVAAIGLSYNFFLHQVKSDDSEHFVLKIEPRADIWAGVELGSGLIINPMPPEDAARYYRI
jgi:UDPglucose--hexose-1-phosphate uridylyltransferase